MCHDANKTLDTNVPRTRTAAGTNEGEVGLGAVPPGSEVAELIVERPEAIDVHVTRDGELVAPALHEHEEDEGDEEDGRNGGARLEGDVFQVTPILKIARSVIACVAH